MITWILALFLRPINYFFGTLIPYMFSPIWINEIRFRVIGTMWDLIMTGLLLAKFKLPPGPATPKDGYNKTIDWVPYYTNNPLSSPLLFPSASFVPPNQRYIYTLLKTAFLIMRFLDNYFPAADERIPLKDKPRLKTTSSCDDYWPLAFTLINLHPPNFEKDNVKRASEEGRFLEWQTNRNTHIYRYLRPANELEKKISPEVTHVVDLTFLEQFEPKKEYYPYGGKMFFKIKDVENDRNIFELIGIIAPRDNDQKLMPVKPSNPIFRSVENQIGATLSFLNVVYCHLLEIHTMCNAVSVALYNAFDVNCQRVHGFRAVMQLHFSHHTEVQEVTTGHLLDERGVFVQVFAYPHETLVNALNEQLKYYEYAYDTDWDRRKRFVGDLGWEEVYIKIFLDYGMEVCNSIWGTDKDVARDVNMQKFYENLNDVLPNGVPERYGKLDSKERVAHFIADSIHTVVLRHEVYGTKIAQYSLYSDITGLSKVPRDNKPFAKENFLSLIQITVGTSMKAFPKIIPSPETNYFVSVEHYKKMVSEVDPDVQTGLISAFSNLQHTLVELDNDWRGKASWANDNLVCIPSDFEIGAGY